ncbi:MAG: DEAD/DEAH box helicase [Actinomycetota bacterium]|nr:DEAD/DEAH box helicase [Actinomycetota bacterium]
MSLALRPYQLEAISAIESSKASRQLVVLPTGSGKTVVFCELISRQPGRSVVLAHREELIDQAVRKMEMVRPGTRVGVVQAGRDDYDAPVVVASVPTLLRRHGRIERIARGLSLVVVDEAHHAVSESWMRVLGALGAMPRGASQPIGGLGLLPPSGPPPLLVGFTATPDRADGKGLDAVFEQIVYERTMWEMIVEGYLADVRAIQVKMEMDLRSCPTKGKGDFDEAALGEMMLVGAAPRRVAKAWVEFAEARRGIVFTPTVEVAEYCAEEMRALGIRADVASGKMSDRSRRAVLRRLETGAIEALCNAQLLLEGFDEPSVDCVVMARPTKSRALYVQAIGRGTRRFPGKDFLLVLDCIGATTTHELVTVASLVGADEEEPDVDVGRFLAERDPLLQGSTRTGGIDNADVSRVYGVDVHLFEDRALHWVHAGSAFALSVPGMRVRLDPAADGTWSVTVQRAGQEPERLPQGALDLEWAQGLAEDLVRKAGFDAVAAKSARWRDDPATDRQIATLVSMGIGAPPGCTKGQAADLIAQRQLARETSAQSSATPKQLALLRRLGLREPPQGLTRRDASRLIDELKLGRSA